VILRGEVKRGFASLNTTTSPSLVREGDKGGGLLGKHPKGMRWIYDIL
jgi:hypothetical protein